MDTIIRRVSLKAYKTDGRDSGKEAEEQRLLEKEDDRAFQEAVAILKMGGLVAFPTETVYGLGGNALMPEAAQKIYAAKGRPSDNPLIVHIASLSAVDELAANVPPVARVLMERFWPGPMTLIFPKREAVPKETTGGLDTVAIRFPSHPVARRLIEQSGIYIAAPSANASGRPSPTKAEHVVEDLRGRIDMILDAGDVEIGLESTIIDVTGDVPTILRPGYITREMLADVIREVQVDPAILEEHMQENLVAKAPGMKYRHYAPKGQLFLVEGSQVAVVERINGLVQQAMQEKKKVAVIATQETKDCYCAPLVVSLGSRRDVDSVAHSLFDLLREMDRQEVDVIYCESFERTDLGQAIMNRLMKAAGYHLIQIEE